MLGISHTTTVAPLLSTAYNNITKQPPFNKVVPKTSIYIYGNYLDAISRGICFTKNS